MDEKQENPLFARCSVGKNRWFWVTWKSFGAICESPVDGAVDDSGYAKSAVDAEEQARASIKAKWGNVTPRQEPTCFAQGVHHRRAIRQRANRKSSATDTKKLEYLYNDYYDGDGSVKHRVVKKTAKRVYVARYPINSCNYDDKWEEDGQVFHDVETLALDRYELETEGVARSHGDYFYTTPWEERHQPRAPRFLEILGLEVGATADAVGAAYRRLAKEHHPDHGGNVEEFKRLQEAYEMAMDCVAG